MENSKTTEKEKGHSACYSIGGYYSAGMLSDNPKAGIYEAQTSRTLDLNGGNPACNQGGICVVDAIGFDGYNSTDTGDKAATLGVNCGMSTGRNGVCIPYSATTAIRHGEDMQDSHRSVVLRQGAYGNYVQGEFGTLRASGGDYGGGSENLVITRGKEVTHSADYKKQTNQAVEQNKKGNGVKENNQSILCAAHGQANAEILEDKAPCLSCDHEQPIVFGMDCRNARLNEDLCGTLQAKPNGGFSINSTLPDLIQNGEAQPAYRYIVRRLTPTECARLQGFPDKWGHPDKKDELTDEEYDFWLKVRNEHASINGKKTKSYTKKQMLAWYNRLHSDSSEYKMWGNGVALPPTLYCMQGICDAIADTPTDRNL